MKVTRGWLSQSHPADFIGRAGTQTQVAQIQVWHCLHQGCKTRNNRLPSDAEGEGELYEWAESSPTICCCIWTTPDCCLRGAFDWMCHKTVPAAPYVGIVVFILRLIWALNFKACHHFRQYSCMETWESGCVVFAEGRRLWPLCLLAAHSSWAWSSCALDGWWQICPCTVTKTCRRGMRMWVPRLVSLKTFLTFWNILQYLSEGSLWQFKD